MKVSKPMYFVSKKVGEAIMDYGMLQDGDKIIIALSGGKDSLSLLKLLKYRQTFIPIKIELLAVHIDMGIPNFPLGKFEEVLKNEGVDYRIEKINILKEGKTWNDISCFWCSWNRRKALFHLAGELGYNKIALGHHLDDIIETILMNLFHNAEVGAMRPKQELFKGKVTLIRPLAYVEEREIVRMCKAEKLSAVDDFQCPHNDSSQRTAMKNIISKIEKDNPAVKKNIFNALKNIKPDYLLDNS